MLNPVAQIFDNGDRLRGIGFIILRVIALLAVILGILGAIAAFQTEGVPDSGRSALNWLAFCQFAAIFWVALVIWFRSDEFRVSVPASRSFPVLTMLRIVLRMAGEALLGWAALTGLGLFALYASDGAISLAFGRIPSFLAPFASATGGQAGFLLGLTVAFALAVGGCVYFLLFYGLSELIGLLVGIHEHGRREPA